ncbi:hypothetical protein MesoLj113c_28190 [Mesorhizobium sp. 113-3-9]|nr:hypothetical protein MesoLj113c_28190 [Mesorhizobium sp. 113-3-9]
MRQVGNVASGACQAFGIVGKQAVYFLHQRADLAGLISWQRVSPACADIGEPLSQAGKGTKAKPDLREESAA